MASKFNAYDHVTNKIIDLMDQHGTGWVKPWASTGGNGLQISADSGKAYRGINQLLLLCSEFGDHRWATYKAWQRMGAQVRKGEKGTSILFFKPLEITDKQTGEEKTIPMARVYTVFNADQVDGAEPLPIADLPNEAERLSAVEAFVSATGADIRHGQSGAFYKPTADWVGMPNREAFTSTEHSTATECYYSTLLHELTHWTGHRSRLNRDQSNRFGDQAYAFEELVAELGAAFACAALGISNEPRPDHAQYLAHWRAVLKKDNRAIVTAAKLAQQAFEYLEAPADNNESAAA